MRLPKNLLNPQTYVKPRIFLCQTDKEKICVLDTTGTQATLKFNSFSELSFEVGRVYNDILTGQTSVNLFYDLIEAPRLILVEGFGYFEIQSVELVSDGIKEAKNISANSLEYNLSTKYLENFYVNQGTVESLEVLNAEDPSNIIPITLYNNVNPNLSLLHLILEKSNGYWTIGHVDKQLQTMSRQFEVDRTSIYDFIINDICEKFNCYAVFDTVNNTINLYAESPTAKFKGDGYTKTFRIGSEVSAPFSSVETVSIDGYKTTKWSYTILDGVGVLTLEDAPGDGTNIEIVGVDSTWETDVFVSFDNLVQEANVSYNIDDIRTVLTVTYGDDGNIREVNLGLPYITDISYFHTVDWMGQDLYDTYGAYIEKSNGFQTEYNNNTKEVLRLKDHIAYEENRLSLEYSLASVSPTTVGTYYIRKTNFDGSYYYSEVSLPADYKVDTQYYSNMTTNVNEEKVGDLYSALKEYTCGYFMRDRDRMYKALDVIYKLEGFDFLEGYALSDLVAQLENVNSETQIDAAVNKVLRQLWRELGRTPLQQLYLAPYQTIRDTSIDAGWSVKSNANYGSYYMTVVFVNSIDKAITERSRIIDEYKNQQSVYQKANEEISEQLLMVNNFTEAQLIRLNAFLREDELHLDDFVETDLDDISSSLTLKQDAMESGKIELKKMCQPQLQFSMGMANIYALPEFEPIVEQFQLGNIIRVSIRKDYVKQSRLLQVNINLDDFNDFSCEFGELTSLRTQSDIHADLLSNAITAGKSVATYSSYWSRGSDTASAVEQLIQQGLLDAVTSIRATDGNQGVVIDKYGIHLRKVNQTTGTVDPKQGLIVNNQFLFSDDGFKSTKAVFGEYTFNNQTYYGVLAEALVGELIVGSELRIGNNSGTLKFDDNGLEITNEVNTFKVNPNDTNLMVVSNSEQDILYLDQDGNLNITGVINATGGNIGGCIIDEENGLQVDVAHISGKLTAANVDVNDVIQVGEDQITKITNDTISTTNVVAENLQVRAAHILDKLSADHIDVDSLTVKSTQITGELTANSIEVLDTNNNTLLSAKDNKVGIAGWLVASTGLTAPDFSVCLFSSDGGVTTSIADSGLKSDWRIIAGGSLSSDYTFGVDNSGNVYASSVNLTGTINAIDGEIGGIEVGSTGLFYSGENSDDGFGLWKNNAHQHNNSNIIIHSGGNNDNIENATFRVYQNGDVVANSLTSSNATITGGSLTVGDNFSVDTSGVVKCTGADIDGVVHLNNGSSIGSFGTDNNSIFSGSWGTSGTTPPTVFMCTGSDNEYSIGGSKQISGWAFGAGTAFGVTKDGSIYANSAYISGGTIGSWHIDTNYLGGTGGANQVRLYPNGYQYNSDIFYLVILDSGGARPVGGITASGWKSIT